MREDFHEPCLTQPLQLAVSIYSNIPSVGYTEGADGCQKPHFRGSQLITLAAHTDSLAIVPPRQVELLSQGVAKMPEGLRVAPGGGPGPTASRQLLSTTFRRSPCVLVRHLEMSIARH